jgi:hypothetical protein
MLLLLDVFWLLPHFYSRHDWIHKGPTDRVSAAKIFPDSAFSRADISLTCLNPRCRLSDHPRFASTWSYFSMHCWAASVCDATSTVEKCWLSATKIACMDYFLPSINIFHWLQATVARGLSTEELIMLSRVQLLIFVVVYALWGPYVMLRISALTYINTSMYHMSTLYGTPLGSFFQAKCQDRPPLLHAWAKHWTSTACFSLTKDRFVLDWKGTFSKTPHNFQAKGHSMVLHHAQVT